MNENFTFLDLLRYAWSHIVKYVKITICTILVYLIGLLIIGSIFPISDDAVSGLLVVLFVTNCTGFLAGKLNRIVHLLEAHDSPDET